MEQDAIHYEVVQPEDVPSMTHVIAESFSTAEPPALAMGLSSKEMAEFLLCVASHLLSDGLTVVARSSQAPDSVVGAMITDDFAAPLFVDPTRISRKFLPIFTMLESLDSQYRQETRIAKGQYLHLFMLAVDAPFSGRGIAQRLVECCLENGYERGYRWAVTEATGLVSQRVFKKLGFAERARVSYRDFTYGGEPVFACIKDHTGVALMDRRL